MAKKPTAAPSESETGQVIYLGPTMVELDGSKNITFSILYGAIFKNGVTEDVADRQAADPDFKMLFVPVMQAGKAMQDLTKETPLGAARERVAAAYAARRKGGK